MIDVMDHTGLAAHAVELYTGVKQKDPEFEDLHQIAMLGICRAARSYKQVGGCKFSTYAMGGARNELSGRLGVRRDWRKRGCGVPVRWPVDRDGRNREFARSKQHDPEPANRIWEAAMSVATEDWQREAIHLAFGVGLAPNTIAKGYVLKTKMQVVRLLDAAREAVRGICPTDL
jgi:DNA-directed RNA polymerase specialized sigma subunit